MTITLPTAPEGRSRIILAAFVGSAVRVAAVIAVLVAVSGCAGNGQPGARSGAASQEAPVTQEQVADAVHVCSTCHGFGGRSISPTFPRLAGQQTDYLIAQLNAFRDRTRADPHARTYMLGMAAHLSDPMIAAIAAYYAGQSPVSGTAQEPTDVAAGKELYQQGVRDKVLPCMACHGGEGEGTGMTPRLAGQHRLSLARQLSYFATNKRTGGLMPEESVNLTERQITEVSAYLANRSAGKPSTAARMGPVTREQVADTARVCSACHEFGDANVVPVFTFPRLAGQQKDYLVAQLKAFRDKSRGDPRARAFMWDRAASLDNPMIERLAAYYAAQTPLAGFAQNATDVAAGQRLYQQGVPDKVLPCMACHGGEGEGVGMTPRLAGQHRLSLARQLSYFATNKRTGGLMPEELVNLSERQITEVSAYLANRSAGKPSTAARTGPVTREQVEATARVCSSCHEFGGANVVPVFTFPRLAGQQGDYLIAQLKAFRDRTRADPRARADMWDRAAHLSDAMIDGLAAYYAAQTPLPGFAQDATDVAAGKRLYQQGVPDKVLPCMACHGGEGEGTGIAPRLAGQHRLSLERQLSYFATNKRTGGLMPEELVNLSERQITDVSAYLANRSAGKPSTAARTGPVTREQVEATARVCSSCHEFGGANVVPVFTFPRLAGQQGDYLIAQLKAFRDKNSRRSTRPR